jgi:hypothetical protein
VFIDELYQEIIDATGSPFTADNLYIGELVREQYGVYLIQSASSQPDMYTGVEEYQIDLWSRTIKASEGFELMEWLYNYFHQKAHYDLGLHHVFFTNALSQIVDMDRDAEGNKLLRLPVRWIAGITVS